MPEMEENENPPQTSNNENAPSASAMEVEAFVAQGTDCFAWYKLQLMMLHIASGLVVD